MFTMRLLRSLGSTVECTASKETSDGRFVKDSSTMRMQLIPRVQSEAVRIAGEVGKRTRYVTVLFNNAG